MHNEKIVSYLTINGFTINPIKDEYSLVVLINSLCEIYDQKHFCDHREGVIHENYLGKQIEKPSIKYIENDTFKGLIGFCVLENGYFVIKIWDNIYPAEVQFDLYLDKKMDDCSIILDHLSCPAKPFDGMGLFDCTYSLTHSVKNKTFISKYDNKIPMYHVNESFDKEKYDEKNKDYYIILNQLEKIECHFCNLQATDLIFFDYPRKLAAVCSDHVNNGSNRELESEFNKNPDIRYVIKSDIKNILRIVNNEFITQNVYESDLDLD